MGLASKPIIKQTGRNSLHRFQDWKKQREQYARLIVVAVVASPHIFFYQSPVRYLCDAPFIS